MSELLCEAIIPVTDDAPDAVGVLVTLKSDRDCIESTSGGSTDIKEVSSSRTCALRTPSVPSPTFWDMARAV